MVVKLKGNFERAAGNRRMRNPAVAIVLKRGKAPRTRAGNHGAVPQAAHPRQRPASAASALALRDGKRVHFAINGLNGSGPEGQRR